MKRRDLIKTGIALGIGGITSIKDLSSAIESIENQYKSKYNKSKNIVIVLMGGGVRFDDSYELLDKNSKTWMPNLFPGELVSHPNIKTLPSISKSPLSYLSTVFKIGDASNKHSVAQANLFGTQVNEKAQSPKLILNQDSAILNTLKLLAKKKKQIHYIHDCVGFHGIFGSDDKEISALIGETIVETYSSSEKSTDGNQTRLFDKSLEIIKNNKPKITIIHSRMLDIAHSSGSKYYQSLNQLDYSIAWLMAQMKELNLKQFMETNWFILPEMGRNMMGNSIIDKNKIPGYDHHHVSATQSWMLEYNFSNLIQKRTNLAFNQIHTTIFNSVDL